MRFLRQISVRLFLLLAVLLVAAFGLFITFNYAVHQEHLERRSTEYVAQTSEIVVLSARHAMMQNAREDIREIIRAIGEQEQVEAVRIYNKSGAIVYSTSPEEVGTTVDLEAEACSVCHVSGDLRDVVPTEDLARRFTSRDGHRILGFISPVLNEPACSAASCHVHPAEQRVLGVLDLQLSLAQVDADLATSRSEMLRDGFLVALVTGVAAWLFITFVVRRPVRRLIESAKRIGRLDLDVDLDVHSKDELGELARTFSDMAKQLGHAREENERWAASLEAKVDEKAAALQRAQSHLVESEKMASLGKLSAVIAHEINNPLAGVLTYARLVSRRLGSGEPLADADRERLREHLTMIESETKRCGETVKNLLLFSKRKAEGLCDTHLTEVIDRSMRLLQHRFELGNVRAEAHTEGVDDTLFCNVDQLQQVLVALLVNAVEAMPDGGELELRLASPTPDVLRLSLSDTGPGIPAEVLAHIFEPFYTTKRATSGVGLGLAVAHGIVESHRGTIEVETSPNGTTFHVTLPRRPAGASAETTTEASP